MKTRDHGLSEKEIALVKLIMGSGVFSVCDIL